MPFHPSREVRGRVLFELRDADDLAQHVIAIQLHQRIPIHNERNDAREHHHEIRAFVNDSTRFR